VNANFEQVIAAQNGMNEAISTLDTLKSSVALAKQVVEFSNDRCKSALSVLVVEFIKQDMSVSAAEHHARADSRYKVSMKEIMTQTGAAERTLKEWELAKLKFESARSILSAERSLLEMR